eukprot:2763929-Amphidinium_carterae.1
MAVRYSATRLERSAATKRCLLSALSSLTSDQQPPSWDSLAKLTVHKHLLQQASLSDAWGSLSPMSQLTQPVPPHPLASVNASQPVEADS